MEFSPYAMDDRLLFIAIALLGNSFFGLGFFREVFGIRATGEWLERLLLHLEKKLNRSHRKPNERALRGGFMLLVILGFAYLLSAEISKLTAVHPFGWVAEAIIISVLLMPRNLFDHARAIRTLLEAKDMGGAKNAVAVYAHKDTSTMDIHALCRSTIETLAQGFALHVLTPLLSYLLLGLPGFILCRIITSAGLHLGYAAQKLHHYGRYPTLFYKLLHSIPAHIASAFLLIAAVFTPRVNVPSFSLPSPRTQLALPRLTPPIATAAKVLNRTLGGPYSLHGSLIRDPWLGNGTAKATTKDLSAMLMLFLVASFLLLVPVMGVLYLLVFKG